MSVDQGQFADGGPAPTPGAFGRFYLQELINSGGMADIWLATDADHKAYALRKLHDHLRFNLLARRRFVRGCDILAHIHNHEHVIGYVEHGKIDGTLYCLMEYVESSNLKQMILRNGRTHTNWLVPPHRIDFGQGNRRNTFGTAVSINEAAFLLKNYRTT